VREPLLTKLAMSAGSVPLRKSQLRLLGVFVLKRASKLFARSVRTAMGGEGTPW
jgi:hypothetical protein